MPKAGSLASLAFGLSSADYSEYPIESTEAKWDKAEH
jgi:hypothetical protein